MDKMNQYDELLNRFLANELNAEEKETVKNWVKASPENFHYFEQLKYTWQLAGTKQVLDYVLDDLNVDERWQQFKQTISKEAGILPIGTGNVENVYAEEEQQPARSIFKKYLIPLSIAASVLLVISLSVKFLFNEKPKVVAVEGKKSETRFVEHHEINTTGKERRIQLPDGSLIVLADKSEISYREPFINSRDIRLTGKALFEVAKDSLKPFTVISDELTTTALGTVFSVTAFQKANNITVRLYEGKVVVKPVDKLNTRIKKDVYLMPGQEFVYNKDTDGKLRAFKLKPKKAPEQIIQDEIARDNPFIQDQKGSWYMFNNQSLEEVLQELSGLYNVKIVFASKDVKNIYFTGKYNKSVPLETILQRIGMINNLTITKNDTAFIITK